MAKVTIIGAGLSGATAARVLAEKGHTVKVIERRNEVGGNCATEEQNGIMVHKHGAHIFHTNSKHIWYFVNRFADFNNYTHTVKTIHMDDGIEELYSMPINMNTLNQLFGVVTPKEGKEVIETLRHDIKEPKNFEEACLAKFGSRIYDLFIKNYSELQWGRTCTEIPPHIADRIPLRFTYDDRYFTDRFQGIPIEGYSKMIENMLNHHNIEVYTSIEVDVLSLDGRVIFCGAVDELLDYRFGKLEYRSLKFAHNWIDTDNYQGAAIMNYCNNKFYTRKIEHKHFNHVETDKTLVTVECPSEEGEPYYPIGGEVNRNLHKKYVNFLETNHNNVSLLGRLAQYRYYDMTDAIQSAFDLTKNI